MSELIVLDPADVSAQIDAYEQKWPDFATVYATPTCCPGCMVPYDRWGFDQCTDWEGYFALRWLRGDEVTYEDGFTDD